MITRNLSKEVQQAYISHNIREQMDNKFGWKTNTAEMIDWELHSTNLNKLSQEEHRFVVRLIYEILPCLGEPITTAATKICPCCKQNKETLEQMLQCKQNKEIW